jgi:hypothetical protein
MPEPPNKDLENELWDDDGSFHPKIFHKGCGGRVVWIAEEEWRCFKCCQSIGNKDMDIPNEPLLNDRAHGPTAD